MAFALFFLGEYANMILMSASASILFLGGWLPLFNFMPVHTGSRARSGSSLKICVRAVHLHLGARHAAALSL